MFIAVSLDEMKQGISTDISCFKSPAQNSTLICIFQINSAFNDDKAIVVDLVIGMMMDEDENFKSPQILGYQFTMKKQQPFTHQ